MSPVDYTWGVGDARLFMIMGKQDKMYDEETMQASYEKYIKTPNTRILWLDRGHKLTPEYVPHAVEWFRKHIM
jgi:hypothetical protein